MLSSYSTNKSQPSYNKLRGPLRGGFAYPSALVHRKGADSNLPNVTKVISFILEKQFVILISFLSSAFHGVRRSEWLGILHRLLV